MRLNFSVQQRSLLLGPIKRARKQLRQKKSGKRLYTRKKLLSSDSKYKRKSRKLLYSVNCGRKLIGRQRRRKRRRKQQKERKSVTKKNRIDNRRP